MRSRIHMPGSWKSTLGLWGVLAAFCSSACSQDLLPAPLPAHQRQPSAPSPAANHRGQFAERAAGDGGNGTGSSPSSLEKNNREHNEQMRQLLEKFGELSNRVGDAENSAVIEGDDVAPTVPPADIPPSSYPDTPVPDYTEGQFNPSSPAPGYPLTDLSSTKRMPLTGTFGPGFQRQTPDAEDRLRVHHESQVDARNWGQHASQVPANSGIFLLPAADLLRRQHHQAGSSTSSRSTGGWAEHVNILNAFINLHFDDRFQLWSAATSRRSTYDQYAISNYWLPTPERSVFTTNTSAWAARSG